jgi:hypothetical protein
MAAHLKVRPSKLLAIEFFSSLLSRALTQALIEKLTSPITYEARHQR